MNITNPSSPVSVNKFRTKDSVNEIQVSGNCAYVADSSNLLIIDISNPYSPTFKGSYDIGGWAKSVSVSDNYAYVANDNGLEVVDISNPSSPVFKGNYNTSGSARSVSVSGDYIYIADGNNGFVILKVNPEQPSFFAANSNKTMQENNTQILRQKNGTVAVNAEQIPEQQKETSIPSKESKKTPGFEIIHGVVCMLAICCIKKIKGS